MFTKVKYLSLGSNWCRPLLWIRNGMFGLPLDSRWTLNTILSILYVKRYWILRLLNAIMLVMDFLLNHTLFWLIFTITLCDTVTFPLLLSSCILVFDLVIFSTKYWMQNISIFDWLSKKITSLRSISVFMSTLRPEIWLKIFAMQGLNSLFNHDDWKPLLPTLGSEIWKWEAPYSSSDSDRSESSS